jgi:hypothetical protein
MSTCPLGRIRTEPEFRSELKIRREVLTSDSLSTNSLSTRKPHRFLICWT